MVSYFENPQQHSLLKTQVQKEPVKEVSNLLDDSQDVSWDDLRGLYWTLFLENKNHE